MKFATILAGLVLLTGCAPERREAAKSSLPRAVAQNVAKTVAVQTGGYVASVAPSGSMRPTFAENAFLVSEPVKLADIRVGDIVVKRSGSMLIVHRVIRVEHEGLVTRGDANDAEDPGFLSDENCAGRVIAIVYGK
jgi:signal peptidase I